MVNKTEVVYHDDTNPGNFLQGGVIATFGISPGLLWNKDVPEKAQKKNLTPQVISGKHLWESNNFMGCLTILAEGVYYVPAITQFLKCKHPGKHF